VANLSGEVKISEDRGAVILRDEDGAEYRLQSIAADEIPEYAAPPGDATTIDMPASDLAGLLKSVAFAVPSKDHRRVLMGVHVALSDCSLIATATDGKRLARWQLPVGEQAGPDVEVVIPADAVACLGQLSGLARVSISARELSVTAEAGLFSFRSIDGKYPDCSVVIPKGPLQNVPLPKAVLAALAKAARVLDGDKVIMLFGNGRIDAHAVNRDKGSFRASVAADGLDFPPREFAFNPKFLLDNLSHAGEGATLHLHGDRAPVTITDNDGRLLLLMPIKLAAVTAVTEEEDQD
jgi:DNA polymerase-3 subunit beta